MLNLGSFKKSSTATETQLFIQTNNIYQQITEYPQQCGCCATVVQQCGNSVDNILILFIIYKYSSLLYKQAFIIPRVSL